MSIGESRVRIDFNPSNDDKVFVLKSLSAQLINKIEELRDTTSPSEKSRLIALAQTAIEEGAMWAVKAATAASAFLLLAASLASIPARAADLPIRKAPAPVVSPFAWGGLYAGLGIGYGVDVTGLTVAGFDVGTAPRGFTGGGRLGYDWNMGPFVFGAVADVNAADFTNSNTLSILGLTASAKTNWWGTADLRFGPHFGNWLLYGVGGVAYGQRNASISDTQFNFSDVGMGWNVGAGVEALLPNSPISAYLETKYVNLGGVSMPGVSQEFHFVTTMAGINLHF